MSAPLDFPPEWRFTSTIETPIGVRVEVTIAVPEQIAGMDVIELAEVAQMCCSRAASQARNAGQTEVAF